MQICEITSIMYKMSSKSFTQKAQMKNEKLYLPFIVNGHGKKVKTYSM